MPGCVESKELNFFTSCHLHRFSSEEHQMIFCGASSMKYTQTESSFRGGFGQYLWEPVPPESKTRNKTPRKTRKQRTSRN